jgi:hypothetical protein
MGVRASLILRLAAASARFETLHRRASIREVDDVD